MSASIHSYRQRGHPGQAQPGLPGARNLTLTTHTPARRVHVLKIPDLPSVMGLVIDVGDRAVNFNGFSSGYSGPGSKTVLPAAATAKLDVRLVPQQDPDRILAQLESHLARHGFRDVDVTRLEHYERAARSDLAHPFVAETVAALTEVYGEAPTLYQNSPGSGPMYPFVEVLGLPGRRRGLRVSGEPDS